MKKSQETFRILADSICTSPTYANAARKAGIAESTLWAWIAASQRGEEGFTVDEYLGQKDLPLHEILRLCTRIAHASIVQNLEHRALHGDALQSFYKGQPCFELDPALLSWTTEELQALGMDPYKRDAQNNLIPVMVKTPPPVALALAVAAAHWPRIYGAKSEVTVNNRNTGVTTIRHEFANKPLPAPVEVREIAYQPQPDADLGDDVDLSDILGEVPIDVEDQEPAAFPMGNTPTEPMVSEPELTGENSPLEAAPAPIAGDWQANLTPAQREILNRLRAGTRTG
jgi:hypothetical protein